MRIAEKHLAWLSRPLGHLSDHLVLPQNIVVKRRTGSSAPPYLQPAALGTVALLQMTIVKSFGPVKGPRTSCSSHTRSTVATVSVAAAVVAAAGPAKNIPPNTATNSTALPGEIRPPHRSCSHSPAYLRRVPPTGRLSANCSSSRWTCTDLARWTRSVRSLVRVPVAPRNPRDSCAFADGHYFP